MVSPSPILAASTPVRPLAITDHATVFCVVAAFIATLVAIGWVFRKQSHNSGDYFCAGGRAKWWLVGGSIFMQSFSAWTFTGAGSMAYQAGWSLIAMYSSNVVALLVCALAPAGWFRQLRVITAGDTVRLRFGPAMEQFYVILQCVMGVLFSGVQLYSLAIFTATLLGLQVSWVILILGVVVLFYTGLSGAWAVLTADFIQGLILLPITVLLAVLCLMQFGGFAGFIEAIAQADLQETYRPVKTLAEVAALPGIAPGYFTWAFFGAWCLYQIVNNNSFTVAGKYLTAKTGTEARKAALLAAGLSAVGMCLFFIPPMAARLLLAPEVAAMPLSNPTEGAYAAMAMHLLPAGLVGVVLVAMAAASLSSLDAGLTGMAGLITQNIYPALCRRVGVKPTEGRARLLLGKIVNVGCATVVVGCALAMASLGGGSVFSLLLDIIAVVLLPVIVPLTWGLFVRRVPQWGAAVSILTGLVLSVAIKFAPAWLGSAPWLYDEQVFAVFGAGTLAFFLARLAWRKDDAKMTAIEQEFFSRRDRPVDFAHEVGGANDQRQMKVVGIFGLVVGASLLLLLIPASSAGHAGKIVATAAGTSVIGALLFQAWRRSRSAETPAVGTASANAETAEVR
jgi:Na+/proline symporter